MIHCAWSAAVPINQAEPVARGLRDAQKLPYAVSVQRELVISASIDSCSPMSKSHKIDHPGWYDFLQ